MNVVLIQPYYVFIYDRLKIKYFCSILLFKVIKPSSRGPTIIWLWCKIYEKFKL